MRWWRQFDLQQVQTDFRRIRAAGLDSVRLFLLWEDFQPNPEEVDEAALQRLVDVADLAAAAGLDVMPTLFTGHMSGVNWIPRWALGGVHGDERFRVITGGVPVDARLRNWYADEEVAASQELLATEAANALAGHRALWAWDLGNENSNCMIPPSREAAAEWLDRISGAIRSVDPDRLITIGLHMEDLEQDRLLGPVEAGQVCDFLCMHGYPIYASWAAGTTDELLLPFLASITSWLGGIDVLFAEFGLPSYRRGDPITERARAASSSTLVEEQEVAAYTKRSLEALHRAGTMGAMLWCYADYDQAIWHEPPLDEAMHERFFGLWRTDGSPKPAIGELSGFVGRDCLPSPGQPGWVDTSPAEFYEKPRAHLERLYGRFRERYRPG